MPMTSTETSKKCKEKQKLNNLEEYRKKERLKNQKYYKKLKYGNIDIEELEEKSNEVKEEVKEEVEDIDTEEKNEKIPKYLIDLNISNIDKSGFTIFKPISKRINPLNKSILQPQTIKLYFNCFKKVYKNYTDLDMDDKFQTELMNLLNNSKSDIKYIKEKLNFLNKDLYLFIKPLNKNDLQFIYSIFSRIDGFAPIIRRLYPYIVQKQIEYQQSRDNKELDTINKIKYNRLSFNKDDIMKIINDWNDYKSDTDESYLTNKDKLLFGLFTLFPVRRPIDYKRMFLIHNEPINEEKKKINERNNYYFNKKFYFYRTKNKDIQIFNVPNELDELIKNYIQDRLEGPLLLDNDNKEYTSSTLRIHIMKVFNKIYEISFSGVELRHYYSTYINYLVKHKELSIEEHKKICEMMNHSYEENKKYAYLLH
jgi:hypothetical protein